MTEYVCIPKWLLMLPLYVCATLGALILLHMLYVRLWERYIGKDYFQAKWDIKPKDVKK